jgi:hypothetical protein
MDDRDAGKNKNPSQCQHKRLLEGVPDREGKKTEMMKCCECGALMPKPSSRRTTLQ